MTLRPRLGYGLDLTIAVVLADLKSVKFQNIFLRISLLFLQ